MKRNEFIKFTGLTSVGLVSGLLNPFESSAARDANIPRIHMINNQVRDMTVEGDAEYVWGWLLRTVAGALISSLVGRVVDRYTGQSCYCNGTSCTANNATADAYSNAEGYYGYAGNAQKFLQQHLADPNTSFQNVSVPFFDAYGTRVTNVEGPFLAGLCYAADAVAARHGIAAARRVVLPFSEISNGGYRFNMKPCYGLTTHFKTSYGRTKIEYEPYDDGSGYVKAGLVKVNIYDRFDNLDFTDNYAVNAG
jgi:hypothetical protein